MICRSSAHRGNGDYDFFFFFHFLLGALGVGLLHDFVGS